MATLINYCPTCPLKKAKEKEVKGVNEFFFTPQDQLAKCYQCHLDQIEKQMEERRRIERQSVSPKKT